MSSIIKFLFAWILPLITWVEPSFTGKDGRSSGRKISSFVFIVLIISTTGKIMIKDNATIIHIYVLAILVCTYLLLIGIITVQNIVDILKQTNIEKEKQSEGK